MSISCETSLGLLPRKPVRLLGLEIDLLAIGELLDVVGNAISTGRPLMVANHNLHSLYIAHHDDSMRRFYSRAGVAHVDGMGIVLLARLLGHTRIARRHRSTYIDIACPLFARAVREGWRVFYIGSRPGVEEAAARVFRTRYPGLQLRTHHGYFETTSTVNEELLRHITDFDPDLLLIGMGMPRQERWLLENFHRSKARASMCCGAMMDYYAGAISTPPRWLGRIGLEWAARLVREPQRLWRRYLIEPWFILKLLVRAAVAGERGS